MPYTCSSGAVRIIKNIDLNGSVHIYSLYAELRTTPWPIYKIVRHLPRKSRQV